MNNEEEKMLSEVSKIKEQNTIRLIAINPLCFSSNFIDEVEALGFKLILQAGVFGDDYLYVTNIPNYKCGVFECTIEED